MSWKVKNSTTIILVISFFLMASASKKSNIKKKGKQMNAQITWDNMPKRDGDRPSTTDTNPHQQLNQQPEDFSFVEDLKTCAFTRSDIDVKPSAISVPGSIALWMKQEHACTACDAFMVGTEFAHFHPKPDLSMHLGLPTKDAETIIDKGWGEWHPLIKRGYLPPTMIMLYAPRNQEELEVAKRIVEQSYQFAKGIVE